MGVTHRWAWLSVLLFAGWAAPASAQNCVVVNGAMTCTVIRARSYSLALSHSTPANSTGNATATFKMNGSACAITPTSTGRVVFMITGDLTQDTTGDGTSVKLVEGTGSAPANAAAATGTVLSATNTWTGLTGALTVPFAITASTTGLTVNVPVWFDLQVADVTGGTASVTNLDCTAHEL